ncbi:hypothetical protein GS875_06075 [Rhodococcus hoagii]|nr:hypothetical protein [Prescottella equi]
MVDRRRDRPGLRRWLEERLRPEVHLYEQDVLDLCCGRPARPGGNLPFHLTTAILRHVLHSPGWTHAVFLVQWEVARRRAGVGGATMMTAQWWPWFDFEQHGRIPSHISVPPRPSDAGVLVMRRREEPLVNWSERARYASFVHAVFNGKGRGIADIVSRVVGRRRERRCAEVLREAGVPANALPKQLDAGQWAHCLRPWGAKGELIAMRSVAASDVGSRRSAIPPRSCSRETLKTAPLAIRRAMSSRSIRPARHRGSRIHAI